MKASIVLAAAMLGTAAQLAWAGPSTSTTSPASPPLQCACVAGGPSA